MAHGGASCENSETGHGNLDRDSTEQRRGSSERLTGRCSMSWFRVEVDGDGEDLKMFRTAGEEEEARRRIGGVPGSAAVSGR